MSSAGKTACRVAFPVPFALLLLIGLITPMALLSSRVGVKPVEPLIRQADIIAIVSVREVKTFQRRMGERTCWEDITMELVPRRAVKGVLPPKIALIFSYRIMVDDRGPCPRLYYVNPPHVMLTRSGEMTGVEVIASIRETRSSGPALYQVTGTYPLDRLGEIQRLLK